MERLTQTSSPSAISDLPEFLTSLAKGVVQEKVDTGSFHGEKIESLSSEIAKQDVAILNAIEQRISEGYSKIADFSSNDFHPDVQVMKDHVAIESSLCNVQQQPSLAKKLLQKNIAAIESKYFPLQREIEFCHEKDCSTVIAQLNSKIQKAYDLEKTINEALQTSPEESEEIKSLTDEFHQNFQELVGAKKNLQRLVQSHAEIESIRNFYPTMEQSMEFSDQSQLLLEKLRQAEKIKDQIVETAQTNLSSPTIRELFERLEMTHETIINLHDEISGNFETEKAATVSYQERKNICLKLISIELETDPTPLAEQEEKKLKSITSYIKKLNTSEAEKFDALELAIHDVIRKASEEGTSGSFKKRLLDLFLFPKHDLPKNLSEIDEENEVLLESSPALDPEALVDAKDEFKDPFLQGNQARYSKEFVFIQNPESKAQAMVPESGKFEGGRGILEKCEQASKKVILQLFQLKKLDQPDFYGHEPSFFKSPISSKDEGNYDELIKDFQRAHIELQSEGKKVIISSSDSTRNFPKSESLRQYKEFIGEEHYQLGIAVGRITNQTALSDFEALREMKTSVQFKDLYSDKGHLYFQYLPLAGKSDEDQEYPSHTLIKQSDSSLVLISNLYREKNLVSANDENQHLLLQLRSQISYRFSTSDSYDPSKEMSLENFPVDVKCLQFETDYQIRAT